MTTTDWSPEQYERFREERSQPFYDLLALVERRPAMRVVDLGAGTGELTRLLHDRLGAWRTLGLDSSEAMLAKSGEHVVSGLTFARGDIASFTGEPPYDLVFSNAALQWVPDHPALLARLLALLGEGGQIAVQMPANHDHPSHAVAAEVAGESPFREALGGYARRRPVLEPEEYATLLHELGFRRQHVRLQVYGHVLAARTDVIEWVKGTLLVDYKKRLDPDLFARFLDRYGERLLARLGPKEPFFYAFKRLLFWAER
jgi:trans-aconitate 2-methyltransferase